MARDPASAAAEVRQLMSMVQQTLDATKSFIFDVRPMVLDDLGLVPTSAGLPATRPAGADPGRLRLVRRPTGACRWSSRAGSSGCSRRRSPAYLAGRPDRVVVRLDWSPTALEALVRSVRDPIEPPHGRGDRGRRVEQGRPAARSRQARARAAGRAGRDDRRTAGRAGRGTRGGHRADRPAGQGVARRPGASRDPRRRGRAVGRRIPGPDHRRPAASRLTARLAVGNDRNVPARTTWSRAGRVWNRASVVCAGDRGPARFLRRSGGCRAWLAQQPAPIGDQRVTPDQYLLANGKRGDSPLYSRRPRLGVCNHPGGLTAWRSSIRSSRG